MQAQSGESIGRLKFYSSSENFLRYPSERSLDYGTLLKINIEQKFTDHVTPNIAQNIFNIFDKYNSSVLLEPFDITTVLTAKELLNHLTKYENWFPTLLKCLKDKQIRLNKLAKDLQKIEGNVRQSRQRQISEQEYSYHGRRGFNFFGWFRRRRPENNHFAASKSNLCTTQTYSTDTLNGSSGRGTLEYPKKCSCMLSDILRSLSANATLSNRSNFEDIRKNMCLLLDIIKEYKNSISILEKILTRHHLTDLLLRFCQYISNEGTETTSSIKELTLELMVYLTNYDSSVVKMENAMIEDWYRFIFIELQNPATFSSSNDDLETKNVLVERKRNLMLVLLGLVRNGSRGKEYFLTDQWKKLLQQLRDETDKFVSDMSLFIQVYIYEAKKILKFLTEKQRNIEETVLGLQDFFKYFSTYNTPSNLAHVKLNAYIDGLVRLASIQQFAYLMKEGDILVHVHNNVQHVNDQMIYKSYLHLISTLGFPEKDFRKTNRRATSGTDTSASGSTKPKSLNSDYDYIDQDEYPDLMRKSPTERDLQSLYNQKSPLKRSHSIDVVAETETLKPDGKEESCFSLDTTNVRNPSTVTVLPRCFSSKEMNHSLQHADELEDIKISITAIQFINIVDKGNFSIVRKGTLNNREVVAVKSMIEHEISLQHFLFEAVLLKRLEHPKIVKILKVVIEETISHIVLEFFPEGNLHKYLQNGGLQNGTFKDIVNIAVQIKDGMTFVHEHQIIHCDLRAANILVGKDNNVKIADFGLARTLHNDNGKHILKDRFPIRWTAPEGLLSDQFSLKSDVWSFGIVMYELITFGREPYTGYSNDEVKELIKKGETLTRPTNLPLKDIPESYYEIMYSCCDFSTKTRPSFSKVPLKFKDNY